MKKIEILLFVYNGEKYLKKQIDSILLQTYKNFVLHIIDDNSDDNSLKIIEEYKNLPNVKIYYNNENLGIVKNVEKYLTIINGDYYALSDQDDIWEKNKLEKQINKINNEIPMLVHSDLSMIDENDNLFFESYFKFRRYNLSPTKSVNIIISQNGVMGNTILFNKKLKELILPFPSHLIVHDYWIALINELFGKRITLNDKLVRYRIHNNNLSNNIKNLTKKNFFSLKLPYFDINRDKVLKYLLSNYKLDLKDREIIEKFLEYLELKNNRILIFYNLIKYNLIKKGFWYRLKIFFKLLLKR